MESLILNDINHVMKNIESDHEFDLFLLLEEENSLHD